MVVSMVAAVGWLALVLTALAQATGLTKLVRRVARRQRP
jgi:hypothetical protein